jgi:ADP-heptose:LPS heptosyltransferase
MKIVLTRLDRVGDLILSTPAIASVRRSWPDAHVTLVCSTYNAVVVERNPDVDAVLALAPGASPAAFGKRFRGDCDLAIALAPRGADFALAGATRARVRVGYTYVRRFIARATAPLFLTKLAISEADPALCDRDPTIVVRHEVDQLLDLVAFAGGRARVPDLVVPIDDVDRNAVAHVPAGGIAFHLGPRWFREGSTLAGTIALIGELRRFGIPIVVTYGVDALEGAAAVRAAGVADAVVGGLSFAQWAATFEKSRMVVTVDTGATHVASATRRPTVVLFEHRHFNLSAQEWSPYRVPSVRLRKPATDAPGELAASRAEVVAAVARLLDGASRGALAAERTITTS